MTQYPLMQREDKLLETIKTLDNTLKPKESTIYHSIRHTNHTSAIGKANTKKSESDT